MHQGFLLFTYPLPRQTVPMRVVTSSATRIELPQRDFPRFRPRLTLTRPKLLTAVMHPPCCPLGVHNCMLDLPRGVGVEHTTCSSASKGNQ